MYTEIDNLTYIICLTHELMEIDVQIIENTFKVFT